MITTQSDGRPISAGFVDAMAAGLVEYDMKLWANGAAVPCVVKSAKLSLGAGLLGDMATEDFAIGQVLTTQLDAQLYDCPDLMGEELQVRVGVKVDGSYEYVTVATVTVSTSKEWKGVTTVQAVGAAGAALAAPAGLSDGYMGAGALATAIGAAAGLSVSLGAFASTSVQVQVAASMSCREALRALALGLGGFAAETPDGNVHVSPFDGTATYTMPSEFAVKAPDLQPEDYEADGLEVSNGEEAYTYGTGRVKAVIQGATAESSAVTWGNLDGYQYRPGRIETALIDPRVTCFDVVSLTMGQDTWLVPSRGIEAKFDGGYFGSYSAAGLTAVQEEALREGPVTAQAANAERVAYEAQQVAEAVNQHFWHDSNGAHVTDAAQGDWLAEYAKPNHGELSSPTDAHPWYNQLMNSAGNLLRTGLVNLASWTRSAIAFYDGQGNGAENIVAQFGTNLARVGSHFGTHIDITPSGIEAFDETGESVMVLGGDSRFGGEDTYSVRVSTSGDGAIAVHDAAGNEALRLTNTSQDPDNPRGAVVSPGVLYLVTGASGVETVFAFMLDGSILCDGRSAVFADANGNVTVGGEVKGATAVLDCTLNTTNVTSGSTMQVARSGNVAQLRFGPIETAVDFADRTTVNVGTLPSGCTPALNANAPVFVTTNIGFMGYVGVTTNGGVSVRCQTGATVPAGTKFYATVPLVLA